MLRIIDSIWGCEMWGALLNDIFFGWGDTMFVRERLELINWLEAQLLLFFLKSWSTMAVIQPAPHCTFDGVPSWKRDSRSTLPFHKKFVKLKWVLSMTRLHTMPVCYNPNKSSDASDPALQAPELFSQFSPLGKGLTLVKCTSGICYLK